MERSVDYVDELVKEHNFNPTTGSRVSLGQQPPQDM
jgi:hypothetical protein